MVGEGGDIDAELVGDFIWTRGPMGEDSLDFDPQWVCDRNE